MGYAILLTHSLNYLTAKDWGKLNRDIILVKYFLWSTVILN